MRKVIIAFVFLVSFLLSSVIHAEEEQNLVEEYRQILNEQLVVEQAQSIKEAQKSSETEKVEELLQDSDHLVTNQRTSKVLGKIKQIFDSKNNIVPKLTLSEIRSIKKALKLDSTEFRTLSLKLKVNSEHRVFLSSVLKSILADSKHASAVVEALVLDLLSFKGSFHVFLKRLDIDERIYKSEDFIVAIKSFTKIKNIVLSNPARASELFFQGHRLISNLVELNLPATSFTMLQIVSLIIDDLFADEEKQKVLALQSESNVIVYSKMAESSVKSIGQSMRRSIRGMAQTVKSCVMELVEVP